MFIDGSRSAIDLMVGVFPSLITIMMAVAVLPVSGVSALLANAVTPVMSSFGLPTDLTDLILLRPLPSPGRGFARRARYDFHELRNGYFYRQMCVVDLRVERNRVLHNRHLSVAMQNQEAQIRNTRCAYRHIYGLRSRLSAAEIHLK